MGLHTLALLVRKTVIDKHVPEAGTINVKPQHLPQ